MELKIDWVAIARQVSVRVIHCDRIIEMEDSLRRIFELQDDEKFEEEGSYYDEFSILEDLRVCPEMGDLWSAFGFYFDLSEEEIRFGARVIAEAIG